MPLSAIPVSAPAAPAAPTVAISAGGSVAPAVPTTPIAASADNAPAVPTAAVPIVASNAPTAPATAVAVAASAAPVVPTTPVAVAAPASPVAPAGSINPTVLPQGFGSEDYFDGGALHFHHAAGSGSRSVLASSALASGRIDVLLESAMPAPSAGWRFWLITSTGATFVAQLAGVQPGGFPETVSLEQFAESALPPGVAISLGAQAAPVVPSNAIAIVGLTAPAVPTQGVPTGAPVVPAAPGAAIGVAGSASPTAPSDPIEVPAPSTPPIPVAMVIEGETAPVGMTQPPYEEALQIAHTQAIPGNAHSYVSVGSRTAAVLLNLPAAPSLGLNVWIADTSGQAPVHAITVDAGAAQIDDYGTVFQISNALAVLHLRWDGVQWKIL